MQRSVAKILIGALFLSFPCFACPVMPKELWCRRSRERQVPVLRRMRKWPQSRYGPKPALQPRNSGDCATAVIELANWPVDCGRANAG
jgi:hypothetical protein